MIKLSKTLILASKSPRRRELLQKIGLNPLIIPSTVEETLDYYDDFQDYVKKLAKKKGLDVVKAQQLQDFLLTASDTIVELKGQILEKPKDKGEAFSMLKSLSGEVHRVYTSLFIYDKSENLEISDCRITKVKFRKLSDEIISSYIETGEPMDKAGAYGIQGYGSQFVEKIDGCFFSVMGFPVSLFVEKLNNLGYLV